MGFLDDYPNVEVRRSARRKRTVAAQREGDKIIILAPQRITDRELDSIARGLVTRLDKRQSLQRSDDELERRAHELTKIYLGTTLSILCPAGVSIRWVTNQNTRWGSCTPRDGSIRLSHRLQKMPQYVIDSVILHELVHLLVPGHGPDFYAWLNRFPQLEQADAYLAGYVHAQQFFSNEL